MLAVDTNIVVRYLTRDDERQAAAVKKLLDDNDILVPITVLLETEWVLRSVYRYGRGRIVAALREFLGLARVIAEDAAAVAKALEWADAGMDIADALHLARTQHCEAFFTFDRDLLASARLIGGLRVREP